MSYVLPHTYILLYQINYHHEHDSVRLFYFFFFQAEDGIRDIGVTGVQTCALPIFVTSGVPPAVIFVFADERLALAVAKIADTVVRGRVASLEDRQASWPYPGRRRMFFAAERDIHEGSLRAFMLPELPAAARRAGQGGAVPFRPLRRELIRADVLVAHRAGA